MCSLRSLTSMAGLLAPCCYAGRVLITGASNIASLKVFWGACRDMRGGAGTNPAATNLYYWGVEHASHVSEGLLMHVRDMHHPGLG